MHRLRVLLALIFACALSGAVLAARIPDFTFTTDKGPLRLDSLRGKVIYLDYWASWCLPCRESFPWMNELQARYGDRGLVVIAVNVDKEASEARQFLVRHPATFTIAYDPDGSTARVLALKGMPSSFLINRQGEIVGTHVGFREASKRHIENEIRALLAR